MIGLVRTRVGGGWEKRGSKRKKAFVSYFRIQEIRH
jgi:hypothetical protein